MGGDIEKILALYERPDIRDCILDFSNEEHVRAVQQVIAAFPEAARRVLAAEARVEELEGEIAELRRHYHAASWLIFAVEQEDDMSRMERRWVDKRNKKLIAKIGMREVLDYPQTEDSVKIEMMKRRIEVSSSNE